MQALVIVAHGSHLNPDASTPTYEHADTIRETGVFDEVETAFWKEEPSFREVLRTLESDEVYVVPLFISEGYFTEEVIPRELRLDGWEVGEWESDGTSATHATLAADDVAKTIHYCGPVGTHDAMTDVIVRRAETVTGDPDVGEGFGLAVVGHGTERNENSAKAIEYHADRIAERDRFDEVRALYMDEDPEVDDLPEFFESDDVVLVPLFIADAYHTQEDIPDVVGLSAPAVSDRVTRLQETGADAAYTGFVSEGEDGSHIHTREPTLPDDIYDALLVRNAVGPPSTVLLRREAYDAVGAFDESLRHQEDWDLYIRLAREFEFTCVSAPLVTRTVHERMMSQDVTKQKFHREEILARNAEELRARGLEAMAWATHHRKAGLTHCSNDDIAMGRAEFRRALAYRRDLYTALLYMLTWTGARGFATATALKRTVDRIRTTIVQKS
jgi:sirohydrochlorin cobaltochelatase